MAVYPDHGENITALKRIEGQVRGLQRMINEKKYCVDIITQIHSVLGALVSVENQVFKKHIDGCVVSALEGRSSREKEKKIDEMIELIYRFRKIT